MQRPKTNYKVGDKVALVDDVLQVFPGEITAAGPDGLWAQFPGTDPLPVTPEQLVEAWDE